MIYLIVYLNIEVQIIYCFQNKMINICVYDY